MALYPGQVVIANIELRLYVLLVVWRSYTVLTLAFHSFDIQGTRTYQLYWTEVTVLGTAWMDAINVAERDDREAEKRKAASSSTASTPTSPAKRVPDVSIDFKPSPKRGPAVKSARRVPSPAWPEIPLADVKGKGKAVSPEDTLDNNDDDLTDLEEEYAEALDKA